MMKKYAFLLGACLAFSAGFAQGYQVSLKAPQYKSGIAYLTYYMGDNFNIADSAAITPAGTAVFKGADKLPPGIYAIFFPGKKTRFEFLVDKSQKISLTAPDTSDIVGKGVIGGAPENTLYTQYQKFVATKGKALQEAKQAYARSQTAADSARYEKNYNTLTKELNDYRENIIKTQPSSMMAVLLEAMREPKLPAKEPVTHQDSLDNYYFYKSHYWDGISFMDDRIIRTPFFVHKLQTYYRDIIPKDPDSIIVDADYKLLLARNAPEMFKFLLNWLTDEYINPQYMGQDAIFVHLFNKYHSKGLSPWLNEKQMETISRRAYMLMANLIGDKAANLEMIDSSGKAMPLYDISADYTVVCFWDPNCGHCKEEVPRLDSFYQASWKNHNVKIYGVLTPDDKASSRTDWVNFIKSHNLAAWVNVYQTKEMEDADYKAQRPSFRQLYDVIMTPTLFLLDKEKRIIGKKLTPKQLNDLLEVKWKSSN